MIDKIMTRKIISADINSSIKDVANLMKENNIGFIPIKDKDNYVGVITDRDICISLIDIDDLNCNIKDYMTNNIISININSDIEDVLSAMSTNKIKRLLVKDNDNYIGIISISDILNHTDNINIIDTFKTIFFIHDNDLDDIAEIDEFYL